MNEQKLSQQIDVMAKNTSALNDSFKELSLELRLKYLAFMRECCSLYDALTVHIINVEISDKPSEYKETNKILLSKLLGDRCRYVEEIING